MQGPAVPRYRGVAEVLIASHACDTRLVLPLHAMTNRRDSSGGYLTGEEAERLWDADEDDAYSADQADDDDDDAVPSAMEPIESIWARAIEVAAEICRVRRAIDRYGRQATFGPDDLPIEGLDARESALAAKRSELEYEMEERGFPPKGWTPAQAELPRSPADVVPSPPAVRGRTPTEILRPHLTDLEFQQYEWMEQRLPQVEIAKGLGISQPAVSGREKKLRARIDAIYVKQTGKPYHWTPIAKPQGGRRRRS